MIDLPASWRTHDVSMTEEKALAEEMAAMVMVATPRRIKDLATQSEALVDLEIANWIDDLGGYPRRAIEAAFANWRRSSRFEPTSHEIIAEITKVIRSDPQMLLERDLRWAKSWLDRHKTIAEWMNKRELTEALISEGYDPERLREAGFTLPDSYYGPDQSRMVAEIVKISGRNLKP